MTAMSVSGISSNALTLTQAQTRRQQAKDDAQGAPDRQDSAYEVSLGQRQAVSDLFAYGSTGALIRQTDKLMAGLTSHHGASAIAVDGAGRPLARIHSVEVHQLAASQALVSSPAADSDHADFGTGTLKVAFASGETASIPITDGTLDGIAAAINEADAGLTATVDQDGGLYYLRLTGDATGADSAFSLSGIPALAYDPAATSLGGMEAVQEAQDARFAVDGGELRFSSANTVDLAPGLAHTLTAIGTHEVSAIAGQDGADSDATRLVRGFDTLLGQLWTMGDDENATDLSEALGRALSGLGLDGIGIDQAEDGSLSLDKARLQKAYTADPAGTRTLIRDAAAAIRKVLDGASGQNAPFHSHMRSLIDQLTQGATLIDYLNAAG
jgi:flagellar hook-associated protein 2